MSFEFDIKKAIEDHVRKEVNRLIEEAIDEGVKKLTTGLRKEADKLALNVLSFYEIEFDRNRVVIKVEKK